MAEGFQIGIETEILATHRRRPANDFADLEAFVGYIVASATHNNKGPHPVHQLENDVDGIYQGYDDITSLWSLTDDPSIRPDNDSQWPVELVSPILLYGKGSTWREEVRYRYNYLRSICRVEINQSCAVHVHISPPSNRRWSLETLKSICRGIFHFESAIEAIVPAHRRSNKYAASNRHDNSRLRGKSIRECLRLLYQCQNQVEIVDSMNDGGVRYFAWNFLNLFYGGRSTIEFRKAPGASDETGCFPWVEFVVSFVNSCKAMSSTKNIFAFSRDVQGLRRFLRSADVSGSNRAILDSLFRGKSGLIDPIPIQTLTGQKQEELDRK